MMKFDRALRLAEMLYTKPPHERLGFMRYLIEHARSGKDKELRAILTMPQLLRPNPKRDKHLFYLQSPEYRTISQAASNYCKRFWRANVKDVVYNRCPEPDTGEIIEENSQKVNVSLSDNHNNNNALSSVKPSSGLPEKLSDSCQEFLRLLHDDA